MRAAAGLAVDRRRTRFWFRKSLADGWWEALVLGRENDVLTLRFRDYLKGKLTFELHRL